MWKDYIAVNKPKTPKCTRGLINSQKCIVNNDIVCENVSQKHVAATTSCADLCL